MLALVGKSNDGIQKQSHTKYWNELIELVYKRIRLYLKGFKKPCKLHVDCNDKNGSIVVVQGEDTEYRVVQILGRPLTPGENKFSILQRLLLVAT